MTAVRVTFWTTLYLVDVCACCRLFPITFATSRRIAKDIELFGYHIPAGVMTFCHTVECFLFIDVAVTVLLLIFVVN